MIKVRDIVVGGYKDAGEKELLTIRESEPFRSYLTLFKNRVSIVAIKHGQREAKASEKLIIKEQAQNLNFEFDPGANHKIWCKLSVFAIAPDPERSEVKVEKKSYKALERIDASENWQQDWLATWLVIDDESNLTADPLLRSIITSFGVKYSNLIQTNNQRMLAIVDPEQVVLPEITLINAIVNAGGDEKRIELQAEVRKIEEESVSRSPDKKDCVIYLKDDKYQLPIDRKTLNISAYVGRT